MPHTNRFQAGLLGLGPLIQVYFGHAQSLRQILFPFDNNNPHELSTTALIDTGASHTVVNYGLLTPLDLKPIGSATVMTAGNVVSSSVFSVILTIPLGEVMFNMPLQVCEAELHGQEHFDCLLGRDVLNKAVFNYNGAADSFSLSF